MASVGEVDSPTHWFWLPSRGGRALIAEYVYAKGEEGYAGLTSEQIRVSQPGHLTGFVRQLDSMPQPNAFLSARIESEVERATTDPETGQSPHPMNNAIPGTSASWQEIHDVALSGEAIPVPYHDVKTTDAQKLTAVTQAYRAYRQGELSASALPDMADVFPDDPVLLAELGFAPTADASGEEVLRQACAQCHNSRLDSSLSRARFVAEPAQIDAEMRDRALERIMLPLEQPGVMPPARFKRLSKVHRERLASYLRGEQ